jgi:hypothetical protein
MTNETERDALGNVDYGKERAGSQSVDRSRSGKMAAEFCGEAHNVGYVLSEEA